MIASKVSGKAPKDQVQRAVQNELKLDRVLEPNDVADACAVALCHYYSARVALLVEQGREKEKKRKGEEEKEGL